ncbi:MAG TPA: FkbM family methyltransferase [Polyangia bacterium]|nr:FkbM family methyltransferase [Polyangia bacterium]
MLIPMTTLIAEHGVRPAGVLHLGAHTGEEAEAYARAGAERVLWFEANPRVMPALERHLAAFPGQRAVHAAVSDADDRTVELTIASNGQSSSLLKMKRHRERYPDITEQGTVEVRTITVDTWLARDGQSPADYQLANLDLQGAELLALRGMRGCLPSLRWIYAEINFEELYQGCPLAAELDAFLAPHGFTRAITADTGYGWADALYVRNR